ncbi:MAG: hypothetical protein WKF94_08950 [Solirubrobacteraceae bacterium]
MTGPPVLIPTRGSSEQRAAIGGFAGLKKRHTVRQMEQTGCELVTRGSSFGRLRAALVSGGTVCIVGDVAGDRPARLLGRDVLLTSGPSELAVASGALAVPVFAIRKRGGQRILVGSVIDPEDCASAEEVHAALAEQIDAVTSRFLPQLHPAPLLTRELVQANAAREAAKARKRELRDRG